MLSYARVTARKNSRTCSGVRSARPGSSTTSTPSATTRWLHTSTLPARRGAGERLDILLAQHFANALERKPCELPLADLDELLDVAVCIERPFAHPLRAIDQPRLDVVAHRAPGSSASAAISSRE